MPSPEERARLSLRQRIAEEIARNGPIPFSRYMELCLYEPELGYYSQARERFGKAGDFYTSSDVHAVFGRLVARQFEEMWRAMDSPPRIDLIELGPGRGLFARDVLDWSAKQFPDFFRALHYTLVEQSEHLRGKLRERMEEHIAGTRCDVFDSFESALTEAGDNIVIFGNEFFDALPVEIIDYRGALRVGYKDGRFVETFVPASAADNEFLDRYGIHPEQGERVEAPLLALEWMERIASAFHGRRGFLVLIDYGYTREEQLAGRHRDTIMCYRQHTASGSPYEAPGEQDITAHVNFTALRGRGIERGFEPLGLVTQAQFLIGIGEATEFADAFQDCKLPQERAKVALQLKHLISPAGMGETFQVLLMSHNVAKEKAASLSGLKLAH
ncbi:MAG TPA: SAM-dependent methyltransferase [Terriglobales bacterium]|jgi:SAM-dependent MidA family methyltransferase|nr:SAM-dependent methyltransferase [Terriglobales bacterium]